jgi:hypothetical protein
LSENYNSAEFISNDFKPKWSNLYRPSGFHSDAKRGTGLLGKFKQLIPNADEYLNNTGLRNWFNILKEIFEDALAEMGRLIEEGSLAN